MYDVPEFPAKLDGTLWAITSYFNPAGYKTRKRNFDIFREKLKAQGIPLLVTEAAIGDSPFELMSADAEMVLQFRTNSILWQKERLLNLAHRSLPPECDKVVCLDADICFLQTNWKEDLCHALERYIVVQPYERIAQGAKDFIPSASMKSVDELPHAAGLSAACSAARHEESAVTFLSGHPGYAIAMRRSLLDAFGLYEKMIVGGGDSLFFGACFGIHFEKNNYLGEEQCPVARDSMHWVQTIANAVQGSVSFIHGDIVHLWHGNRNDRFYAERRTLLEHYDPSTDIHISERGCIEWTHAHPSLEKNVALYFLIRNEDGVEIHHPETTTLRAQFENERQIVIEQVRTTALEARPQGWRNPTMQEP